MKFTIPIFLCLAAGAAQAETVRVATYNASLNRQEAGALAADIAAGESIQAQKVAEVIAQIAPDLLLLNEFDYAEGNAAAFNEAYLSGAYGFSFEAPSNTGLHSGLDLDGSGNVNAIPGNFDYANDSYGFGMFEGQYGMAVFSKHEILFDQVRTFQKFKWADMPDARRPMNEDGTPFYPDEIWAELRLSSKSHWDIPVLIGDSVIHFLVSHPTPPVFDGPEDKNGKRNADEIRFWADYISGANYMTDDQGRSGGLAEGAQFVIAGDLNADPMDGDSTGNALNALLELVNTEMTPRSEGAIEAAKSGGGANLDHEGPAEHDTADWNNEGPGNLRVDYVLPSKNLRIEDAQVFWPEADHAHADLISASDHRAVWLELKIQ